MESKDAVKEMGRLAHWIRDEQQSMDDGREWLVEAIDLSNMQKVFERQYSSGDLIRALVDDDHKWAEIVQVEEVGGIKFDYTIEEVDDYHEFVESFLRSRLKGDWSFEDTQNIGEKGHPDFIVHYEKRYDGLPFKDGKVYIEFKFKGDSLRKSQWDWALERVRDGFTVWVMWLDKIE